MADYPVVLDDAQLAARLSPQAAVAAIRQALIDAEHGTLTAPARVASDLGAGRLVFTTGARAGEWFGYRSYDTFGADPGTQVVVVHDWHTGLARAVAVGHELGRRRTGAIGGVAVDVLARPEATRLALIGTGTQAWAQLWAVSAVRAVAEDDTPHMDRMVSLGSVIEGTAPGRTDPGQITLFCSVGLAGTEVHLLAEVTGQARA